jgi:hypothetical protein
MDGIAFDKRQRDAIIYKPDKKQEMRILVIYYIEMRARYFNAFAENIYAILTNINILNVTEHREIQNISAITQQQTQWKKNIPKKLLDILIEQADRNKTDLKLVKNIVEYYYEPNTENLVEYTFPALIAQSEKRFGLFPDDGLFEMFTHLTNKDIRAKMIAENKRITSFLQSIQNIMMTIDEIHRVEGNEANRINKYIVSLSERFDTTSRLSSLLLLRSKKIAPKPIVSSVSSVSDELAIDKKAPLLTQMFAYSQSDLIQFLTITDYVLQRLDTLSLYLVKTKNDGIDKLKIDYILLSLVSICERRNEYIHKMHRIHIINGFNPEITTYPSTYTSVLMGYKGGRKKNKPKSITKDTKKKKVMPKPKPTRRIRLRFP